MHLFLKILGGMANSVDPDQIFSSAVFEENDEVLS